MTQARALGNQHADFDVAAQRAAEHLLELRQPLGKIDHARLQHLPPREGEQLAGEALAALRRVGDGVEQLQLLLVADVAAQPVHAAADDHEQVVEVVGDAAGQLADGFEPLRLPQRAFRRLAAVGLLVEPPRAPQRDPEQGQDQQSRGQAEDQVHSHGREPFGPNRSAAHAGEGVDRKARELAKADAAGNAVDLGVDREQAVVEALADGGAQHARGAQSPRAIAEDGKTREVGAVRAHQRVETAGRLADQRIEVFEIARPHRHRDDAVEGAVRRFQATGEIEEIAGDAGQPRRAHIADIGPGVAVELGLEIIAIAEVDAVRHGGKRARHQRPAVAADEKNGVKLRHRRHDAGEALMQARLRRVDLVVRHAAHDLVDFREGAIDRLEHLERLLLHDVERANDALVGDRADVAVADPGGISEQRRRQNHRRDHHQLQQADGRFPCGAHRLARSGGYPAIIGQFSGDLAAHDLRLIGR